MRNAGREENAPVDIIVKASSNIIESGAQDIMFLIIFLVAVCNNIMILFDKYINFNSPTLSSIECQPE